MHGIDRFRPKRWYVISVNLPNGTASTTEVLAYCFSEGRDRGGGDYEGRVQG